MTINYQPTRRIFNNAYHLLRLPSITSKTRETAFQVLNRTIWTNNKAFKSGMRDDPNCDRCGRVETMEHLLSECEFYSEPLWDRLGNVMTQYLNIGALDLVPRVDLGQHNIIFNVPHPSLLLHVKDKQTRNAFLIMVQEIKRDIIYRRMNLPPSARQIADPHRLAAHLDYTFKRLQSYLKYIGLAKYAKASETIGILQEINLS